MPGARLLDRVSLAASPGDLVGVIGPNGAGKSTLLKAMAGLLRPTQGSVTLQGQDLRAMPPRDVARRLAMVPQLAPYTYGFTALEVVMMGRYPHMGRFEVEGEAERQIAHEALAIMESEPFAGRAVATLSGGERQRVMIARALAQQPAVLLLDEPTASLDVQHQLKTLDVIRDRAANGVASIAAIHDLALAARYCDRLLLLNMGRVLAEGTPAEVLTPAHIEEAFGVRAVVYPDPLTGTLAVSLLDTAPMDGVVQSQGRVHLVCGAGSGGRLMYELREAGYTVTAGVLGAGDTDRFAADILGVPYVPVPAFGGIDDEADAAHRRLVGQADVVVLCETPVGPNNLRNLQALTSAGRLIILESSPFESRDYTGGPALRVYEALSPQARCRDVAEGGHAVRRLLEQRVAGE